MPQQLIYTSAPRGLVAGRSGHCTVARSASMREALMLQLEKLCYYQHLSLSGGRERPIFTCRIVDIRGSRFHVLSRIQDAGLDFTGRTNFIAHHLVFTPEEIRQFPTPPVILRDWPGWLKSWMKEPQLLDTEEWAELTALADQTNVPAQTWQRVTGDAVNGYGLLEARAGASFRVDDQPDETILKLFSESLELLEVRDTRRDFRVAAWNYTFTTSMQEQDNPADFRWRCIHSDNPAANRFATPDCRALSAVRATKWTGEETAFARTGRQAPRFVLEPQDLRVIEGEMARFQVQAEGVPQPHYQWFSVDRAGNGEIIAGANGSELVLPNPPLGVSRYIIRANNSAGEATTNVATLSVEQKLRLAQGGLQAGSSEPAKVGTSYIKSEEDIERQRKRLQAEREQEVIRKRTLRNKILFGIWAVALIAFVAPSSWKQFAVRTLSAMRQQPANSSLISSNKSTDLLAPITTNNSGSVTIDPIIASGRLENRTNANSSASTSSEEPSALTGPNQKTMLSDEPKKLPAPWAYTNVGNAILSQAQTADNGAFSFTGSGKNFSANSDSFFFASQYASNSVRFIARLSNVSRGTNTCQCGIMMRESNQSNAPFVFLGVSATNIIWTQRASIGVACNSTKVLEAKLPIFLRLQREDDVFIGDVSTNGIGWIGGQTNKVSMTESNYLLGFAVTSGKPALEVKADFDSITNQASGERP